MSDSNTFTAGDHEWGIRFNVVVSDRLEKIGLLAFNAEDLENVLSLFGNTRQLANALWVCVERQAKSLGVTKDDFMGFLSGAELEAGFNALLAAFISSQVADMRPVLRQAVEEFHRSVKAACDAHIAALDAIDLDAYFKQRVEETLAKLREYAAPTPEPTAA